MASELKNSLKQLGFKDSEIKVYIALTQLGESTAAKVAKKADLPRTTVISVLEKLKNENYLTSHKYRGSTYYWIESPKILINILESKMAIANQLSENLTNLYRSEAHFPFGQVYDTKSGVRNFIEKTVSNSDKGSTIYTIDTPHEGNYSKIYSNNIENIILSQKKKRSIKTKTLVPFGSIKSINLEKLEVQEIEIREMPEGIKFEASLWLVQDMLVHFSGNPPFVVAVKHEKIVLGAMSIFNFLWSISRPVKFD